MSNDNISPAGILKEMKRGNVTVQEISSDIFRATSTSSNYIIEYDKSKCIGAASCSALAPLTFFMNDNDLAEFRTDVDEFDSDEAIMEGAQSCPVFAIKIINKTTNEVIFPID